MKKRLLIIVLAAAFFAGSCQEDVYNISFPTEAAEVTINTQHPMKDSLEAIRLLSGCCSTIPLVL